MRSQGAGARRRIRRSEARRNLQANSRRLESTNQPAAGRHIKELGPNYNRSGKAAEHQEERKSNIPTFPPSRCRPPRSDGLLHRQGRRLRLRPPLHDWPRWRCASAGTPPSQQRSVPPVCPCGGGLDLAAASSSPWPRLVAGKSHKPPRPRNCSISGGRVRLLQALPNRLGSLGAARRGFVLPVVCGFEISRVSLVYAGNRV